MQETLGEINESFAEVDFGAWQFFGKPRAEKLMWKADRLNAKLAKLAPGEQFVISYNFDPKVSSTTLFGLFKKYHLGTIEVRRTLSRDLGLVASVTARADVIHEPSFVTREETLFSLFTALPAERRAQILVRALTDEEYAKQLQQNDVLKSLISAFMADIAIEQSKATPKTARDHLAILDTIVTQLNGKVLPAANQKVLVESLANLSYLASSQVKWWMYLVPLNNQRRVSSFINSKIKPIVESLLNEDKAMKKLLAGEVKKKVKELALADSGIRDRDKTVFKRYASGMVDGSTIYWDHVEALVKGRIFTAEDIRSQSEKDSSRLQRQTHMEALLKEERAVLCKTVLQ